MNSQLQKNIMRDVYYACMIHALTRPLVRRGIALIVLVYILSILVHVSAIIVNISAVGIANLFSYALDAVTHTDFWTLATFLTICIVFAVILKDAFRSFAPHFEIARL